MGHPLPGPLAHLAPLLDRYGYAAVALLVLAEGVGIPTPAVTILVAASVYAGAGHLDLPVLVITALLAASAGDNLGYALGHYAGKPAVLRWGRYVGLTSERAARAERFFAERGGRVVPLARFVDGLRQTNGLITGAMGMPWRRYLLLDALGAALWTGVWVSLGYLAGNHIGTVYRTALRYETYAIVLVAALAAAALGWHLVRRRRRGTPAVRPVPADSEHVGEHVGRGRTG